MITRVRELRGDRGSASTQLVLVDHTDRATPDEPITPTACGVTVEPSTSPSMSARPGQTKTVRLHVLGPVTCYVRDHQDPVGTQLRAEVHDFLAVLAAHPTGLLASDIAEKLPLDAQGGQNELKNLRRAVRRALRAATGITGQEFILLQGELHKLHPNRVETDFADFNLALDRALSVPGEKAGSAALRAVGEALSHYRGPFAQGSDHVWSDAIREHLATRASDAVLRVARQSERDGAQQHERDAVLTMLEHLTTIHPDCERLAQQAIRLYQAVGPHDAARHAFTRLKRSLAALDLEPGPATQALMKSGSHAGKAMA